MCEGNDENVKKVRVCGVCPRMSADKRHTWRDLKRLIPDMTAMGLAGYSFVCRKFIHPP